MKYSWLFFVAGAVLTWGAYVVTIDHGRTKLAEGVPRPFTANAAMRAFLFIGLAYFVMAVIVPGIYLKMFPIPEAQDPGFNLKGSVLSTIAGILGAAGALCIVFAVGHARRSDPSGAAALYVAPLVFSFAPIINCIISLVWDRPENPPKPMFFVGIALAAAGAALVLLNKPAEARPQRGFAPVITTQNSATQPGPQR